MDNIIQDVAQLTTISEKHLLKLNNIFMYCILESVQEAILNNETSCIVDIGLGQLIIDFNNNELKFKFKPNTQFKTELISTIKNHKNLLELELEYNLVEKLTKIYKEII